MRTEIVLLTGHVADVWLDEVTCKSHKTLNVWEKELNPKWFVRSHKGYIVNIRKVKYIDEKKMEIVMDNDYTCRLSRRCRAEVMQRFHEELRRIGR